MDSQLERSFLTAFITSKPFLAAVAQATDINLIPTEYFRRVASWCVEHFQRYNDAPGRSIEPIYYSWAEKQDKDSPQASSIHDLLEFLSDQYDTAASEMNVPYLVDEFSSYLSMRALARLSDDISSAVSIGDEPEARRALTEYRSPAISRGVGFDPFTDRSVWERAFSSPLEPVIKFPGDAGIFLNNALVPESLIGIQGPEKRGKTFMCIEFAMRALRERKKVAFFEVGDLTERQITLRLGVRLSGMPLLQEDVGTVMVPRELELKSKEDVDSEHAEHGKPQPKVRVVSEPKECTHIASYRSSRRACRKFLRSCAIPEDKSHFKISVHANSSINVAGIDAILKQWVYEEDFVPDVIIIDYADILAPENTREEFRHAVNTTWKAMRKMSQDWHALVIAPTQADAASYKTETLSMQNFSEDKRKYAHVTGLLGLNQTPEEKEIGVMRLNWIVLRESKFQANRCLHIGQCLQLGRAFCCGVL